MTVATRVERDEAWLAAFEASRSRLFSLAYRILGVRADAEDVVQDTFVKWHLRQQDAEGTETPAAWLTTVARRTAIDYLRRSARESRLLDDFDVPDPAPAPHALAEHASDLSHGMRRMFERLSAEERTAFLLREAFDKDYASIARILDRSAVHCRQIVHRAKDRVRDDRRRNSPDALPALPGMPDASDSIEPMLDAIARQDVHALVALMALLAPATGSTPAVAATIRAAMATHALIARLRIGRMDWQRTFDAVTA